MLDENKGNIVERFSLTSIPLGFNVAAVSSITEAAKLLGRRGGLAKSKAKVVAAQNNGKKGGRPRKKTA